MTGKEFGSQSQDCVPQAPTETVQIPWHTIKDRVATGTASDESAKVNAAPPVNEVVPRTIEPSHASPWPTVAGYEILSGIGRGSMGVVYKARQISLQRLVALKMIRFDAQSSQEELQRFISEARVLASLQHPNIVQLFEINLEPKTPYFSMELVTGGNLSDRLNGRPQPFQPTAHLVLTLARAIHVAHLNGIVHRDLKPANILIAPFQSSNEHVRKLTQELGLTPIDYLLGAPKITDFGLAKQLHTGTGQTESGMILGTPSYMAPEQAEGNSSKVGPAADIYGLGAILYEMLTGRPPFVAESNLETVLQLFQAEPVAPSQMQPKIPRDLETICLKCLQKDPRRRYASAEELAADLQRFLNNEPILAKPPSLVQKVWKWTKRRPALATLSASLVVACSGLMGLTLWHQVDLRAKLGQALADEREAREAHDAAIERERLAQLKDKLKDLLRAGERALATQDWPIAELQLARARDEAADEPDLADLQIRIAHLLWKSKQQQFDYERLEKFHRCRNEALFYATLFTGDDLASALQETRTAAWEALSLFGVTQDSTSQPTVNSSNYTEPQKTEILGDCYELLVTLAEAAAQPLPGASETEQRRQAQAALEILDRAAQFGVTTQAFHRRRAQYLKRAGGIEAAEQEHQHADSLHPSTVLDHFLLGQEQYRQGATAPAILAFENVLQLKPDHYWASYYLALCCLKTQRPDKAAVCLTACLGQRRDFPWLYLLRASAWSELGQFARAEADFAAALQSPLPDTARYGLLVNRGVMRLRQGSLDSARADLQQAITLRPQQYQGYVNLAQAHLKGQQLDEAVRQMDQALQLEPSVAALYRTRARLHLLRTDSAAALADLDQVIRLEVAGTTPALADDHFERGRLLQQRNEDDEALAAFDEALRLRPQDARTCRFRAEALLELNRLPEALQSLDDCLRFGPPDAGAFRARANLRTRLGLYAGAQTDYTRALELEPDAATFTARGWCFLVADASKLALPDFDEAIRLASDQSDAYAGRGYCRVKLGDAHAAIADAEEALRHGSASPRLFYNVTRIFAQAVVVPDNTAPRARVTARSSHAIHCLERAVQTLTQALATQSASDAAHFWQTIVETDKVLNPIRQSPGFKQLAARYSTQRASADSPAPVPLP